MSEKMGEETTQELQDADDEQIGRFCDAFVSDFDGTYTLVINALERDHESPIAIVEMLGEILRQAETWLPAETCERFESELIPHVVQAVLAKSDNATMDAESVESVVDFLEIVLERVASRLLYCDACLLPTLLRIVDENRPFYENACAHSRNDTTPFVTENRRVSPLYLRVVSHWGAIGGFTLSLRCLQASACRPDSEEAVQYETNEVASQPGDAEFKSVFPFDAIQCIYRSIYAMKDHLSPEFLVQYCAPLVQSSRIYVSSMAESEFAGLSRDKLVEIIHIVELVVAYASATEEVDAKAPAIQEAEVCVQLLQLDMMMRFFKTSSLEKRIYGLVEMSDILNKSPTCTSDCFLRWIKEHDLVEVLFGEKKHPELIKRATTLLRFIITRSDASAEWFNAMWTCFAGRPTRHMDGSEDANPIAPMTCAQTHEVVRVSIHCLLVEVVGFSDQRSLQELLSLVVEYARPLDVDVLTLLTALGKRGSALRSPVTMYMWQKLPQMPKAIADIAIEDVVTLLNYNMDEDNSFDTGLVNDLVQLCINSIEANDSSASVSLRLLEKIGSINRERGVAVQRTIADRLVPVVLDEIAIFERKFREMTLEDSKQVEADAHIHGIRERLLALRACMIIAKTSRATYSALDTVMRTWDVCIDNSPNQDEASSLCFQWIEYCFRTKLGDESNPGRRLLDTDAAEQLLQTKFLSLDAKATSMSALSCFHHLFRKVNIINKGIAAYSSEGAAIDDNDDHADEDGEEVSDLLTGEPVVGFDSLWHFALTAGDQLVAEEAITLLARYHLDMMPSLEGSEFAYQRKRDFLDRCIRNLQERDSRQNEAAASIQNRSLDCLRYFLDANQLGVKNKGDVKTSPSLQDHETQMSQFALDSLDQKLQLLDAYPSPLKDIVYPPINENGTPTMMHNGPRRPSWNFKQHHALLEAIQDEYDNESGSPELENQDADQDGRMLMPEGVMRRGELCIEIPTSERRLSIDTSVVGNLRPTQITTSPSVQTRPNLKWFHETGTLASEGLEIVIQDLDESERLSPSKQMLLPVSQLLVNWPGFFDSLFGLTQSHEDATCKRAWGLLCQLPISSNVLKAMVRLRPASNRDVEWPVLLDSRCPFRLLYALRLVEALLLSPQQIVEGERQAEDSVKRQWRERFLRLGGVQYLISLLETILSQEQKSSTNVSCVGTIARILAYFGRLQYSLTNVKPSSPFDSRLLHSTLPMVFPGSGESVKFVFAQATEMYKASLGHNGDSEVLSLYATQMFCAFLPHNPSLAMAELTRLEGDGITKWLRVALTTTRNFSREKANESIAALIAPLTSHPSGHLFLTELLKSSLSILCDDEITDGHADLSRLVVQLSSNVSGVTDWVIESSVLAVLLSKVASLVGSGQADSETVLPSLLRVIAALGSQSDKLRDIILAYHTESSNSEQSNVPWIIRLLSHHVLWLTCENSSVTCILGDAETRRATQEVLNALIFESSSQRSDLLSHLLRLLYQHYARVQNRLLAMGRPWSFRPEDELQDRAICDERFAGLINPGCVCYMNSLMQQLFMMPAFRSGLLSIDLTATSSEWGAELAELQKLFVSLASTHRKALDPSDFALSHRDMDGNPTDLNVQMDADEFFCLLLDRVETCLLSNSGLINNEPLTFLDECFGGVLVNQIVTEHGHLSEREEKFFALSLDISQKQHLPESLALYVQGETLEGDNAYYCEQAKKKVSATKRVCIKTLPRTLVCHLKRFEFDFDTMEKIKIHDYMAFPEEIDMFPYTSEAFSTEKIGSSASKPTMMYDLVGIVVHSGSSDMGHYYSFIKNRSAKDADDTGSWFEFNDQSVKPFDISTMGDECFGGEEVTQKWDHGSRAYVPVVQRKKRSAYMLVYEQRQPTAKNLDVASIVWEKTPLSVQQQHEDALCENHELHHIVNVVSKDHLEFLKRMVEVSLKWSANETPESVDVEGCLKSGSTFSAGNDLLDQMLMKDEADLTAMSLVCQHVFAISGLLNSDEESKIASLLSAVENWLDERGGVDKKLLLCEWLLRRVTTSCPLPTKSDPKLVRRSLFFDILIFCDKRMGFVQNCFSTLTKALSYVVTNSPSGDERSPAAIFLRSLCELFYERDDIEIEDPATRTHFPIPQGSIIHGITLLASFLKDCAANETLRDVLLKYSGLMDRFLFGLQDSDSPRRSKGSGMAPLTSRVRSCTFSAERQLFTELVTSLESSTGILLEDPRLLMNQSVLKNLLVFEFDESLTPFLVHIIRHQFTRIQTEKLVSVLLAVLEELKSTHLDQLLRMFGALLDVEGHAADSNSFPSFHQHIFSPTSGLLEAAAYYRDHRTLHEYAFLLVEFVVTRGSSAPRLQRYFQDNQDIAQQVSWVNDWLGNYLDANGSVRRTLANLDDESMKDVAAEDAEHDEAALEREVRRIFKKAERTFGFSMEIKQEMTGREQTQQQLTFAALEDCDDVLFSSDGENQDDDVDDSERAKSKTRKRSIDLDRLFSDQKQSRIKPKADRHRPEVVDDDISSSCVVHGHMSTAA